MSLRTTGLKGPPIKSSAFRMRGGIAEIKHFDRQMRTPGMLFFSLEKPL